MSEDRHIPEEALSEKFLAATGPGGQNVNKVATACQLRVDVFKLGLSPQAYAKLKEIAGSRMTAGGELVITARRYRTQEANREDALAKFYELIKKASEKPKTRHKTKPTKASKEERIKEKKKRGEVKKLRKARFED